MRAPNSPMGFAASDSPLPDLRPVFWQDEAPLTAVGLEQTSRGAGLFAVLLLLGVLALVGYILLSACADGSPLAWLHDHLLAGPR